MDIDIEQIPVHRTRLDQQIMETAPIMLDIVTEIQPEQNNLLALINEVRGRSYMCELKRQGYDEDTIQSEYKTNFQFITNYPKGTKYDPLDYYNDKDVYKGLILVVPAIVLEELQKRKTKELIPILNHRDFLNSILGHVVVAYAYDSTRKIIEIYDVCVYGTSGRGTGTIIMTNVLDALLVQFPNDALIWLGVLLGAKMFEVPLKLYTRMGFSNPYITNRTPMGSKSGDILALYRQNDYIDPDEIDTEDARILIDYVIREYQTHIINPKTCNAYAYFKPSTGRYLRSLARAASTQDISGKITQKEVAGAVILNKVVRSGESLLYEIVADKKTISTGEGEAVDAVPARYTYHTHPRSAYITHNVRIAWPSAQDYVGFAISFQKFGTVFHLVVSLEGIYVIKLTKEFLSRSDLIADFPKAHDKIREKYDLLYPSVTVTPSGQEISCQVAYPGKPCTGVDYVGIVNQDDFRIRQDIPRIFDVSFLSWEDVVRPVPFSFVFPRIFDVNCEF